MEVTNKKKSYLIMRVHQTNGLNLLLMKNTISYDRNKRKTHKMKRVVLKIFFEATLFGPPEGI